MSEIGKPATLARFLAPALLALVVSAASAAWAAEEGSTPNLEPELSQVEGLNTNPVDNQSTQQPTAQQPTADEKATPTTDTGANTPEQGRENLKNRELGDAFRSFQPSEEISADNAVPFPVDI